VRTRGRTPPICHGAARARGDPACGAEPERAPLGDDGRTTRHAGYAMSLCLRKRMAATAGRGRVVMPQSAFRYNFVSHARILLVIVAAPQPPSPLHRHHYRRSHRSDSRIELGALLKLGDLNLTCVPAS
jgi:hypothetical protein